jgi:calcineurin-like phosphoesterase family protein
VYWFTADNHFNHANIISYCNRPFQNVVEMNEAMIKNWNDVVDPSDIVYIAGDLAMKKAYEILPRLKGQLVLIEGSHDEDTIRTCKTYFRLITPRLELKISGRYITLSHYCMRVWPKSHYNSWHLFGHSHGCLEPIGKSWDIGVDKNEFRPLSFDEIVKIMETRPDNH